VKLAALVFLVACGQHDQARPAPPVAQAQPPVAQAQPPVAQARPASGSGADIKHACSMITAAEVSGIVGFTVTAQDDQYRCKFVDGKAGWLSLELMESTSRSAHDICEYAPDKRTAVPGVGDAASYFGATACVKLGDVAIVVDGANLSEHSDALGHSGAQKPEILVAKLVASRIP
jgi:hypothetical protein